MDKWDEWKSPSKPSESMFPSEISWKHQKALRISDSLRGFQRGALSQYDLQAWNHPQNIMA